MRTKTLLIAASALAAAVIQSQAQSTVYSQNIVGYINLTASNTFIMGANQLNPAAQLPTTNTYINVLNNGAIDGKTEALFWTGTKFNAIFFDCADNAPNAPFTEGWYDANATYQSTNVTVNPGQGFFIENGQPTPASISTAGNVLGTIVNTNFVGTNIITIPAGLQIYSVPIPLGGLALDNPLVNFPCIDLTGSGGHQTICLTWTGTKYNTLYYDNTSDAPNTPFLAGWYDANATYQESNPATWAPPGGSFFVSAPYATNWTQIYNIP